MGKAAFMRVIGKHYFGPFFTHCRRRRIAGIEVGAGQSMDIV